MQAGKQGHRSQLRTRDSKGSGSRVSRKGLRQAVLTALDEDGLVCLLSDHGYGLYSLGSDLARHLRFQKNSVQVLEFQTVSKEKLIPILKKIEEMTGSNESCKAGDKGDKSGKGDARKSRANAKSTATAKGARGKRGETADARPYHFFLDFPALEEDEALSVLPVFKKILKKAKVCVMGAPRLDLFNDYLPKHKTFCARDFLVSKSEEASWALSDEEPFLHFLEETKGVVALAEARYLKTGRKHAAKDGQGAQSTKEMMCAIAQGLVEKAMASALLREEKELLVAMILLRHGTRAGVSKFDCNQKSVSGSLLTLAVFETQLVQTAHENVPQEIGQEEALDALRFLKHPGYEAIYAYEKLFLQLLSRLTDPSALISDAEETLRFALQKNDALAAATSFCAGSFNGIFSADFEKSVAFAKEAEKLAGKQQMVLLEQLAVIFQEGASSEVGHLRKRKGDVGALKWVGEAEGEALDAEASDGAEDSVTLDAPRMLHLILINIKKKLDYQRKHKSARRRSEKEKRKVETGLEADAAASADAPDIPSFVSASSVLGPLWEGVVLLVMEKNETLGDELWRELPAQWKNSLLEHSKESAHAGENVGQSFKGAPPQIFSASRQLHDAQDAQGTQGAQDVQDVQDVRGSLLSRRESLKADAIRKDVVSLERRALRHENILSISLLNNFSVRLSGRSVPESAWRRESAKNLLLLLAATPNHTLTKPFILKQLWPGLSSSTSKSLDNNFYTALSDLRKALLTEEALRRKDVPFLTYMRGNLGLVMEKVEVDMDEFYFSTKRACSVNSSDAVKREEALRALSLFGTGPKFPQAFSRLEEAHLIKSRLTREFSEAAIEGALAAFRQDFVRDATRLSLAAVAASPLHQEIAEDAMNMLLEAGKTEEARKVYKVFSHSYKKTFGHVPEGEIQKLAARLPAFAPEKTVFQKRSEEVAPPRMSLVA